MKIEQVVSKEIYGAFLVEQLTRDTTLENLVAVDQVVIDKNKTSSVHRHNHSDTVLYITEGSGSLQIDDQRFLVKAGDRIHIPPKSFHGVTTTTSPLHFISIQSPPILNKKTGKLDLEDKVKNL